MKKIISSENRGVGLLLVGIFIVMLAFNLMTPMFADDYFYVLNLKTEKPISRFLEIFDSIGNFRAMHNGRLAAHFFAQVFLYLPKVVFSIVNAAMCSLLFYGSFKYFRTDNSRRNTLLLFCAAALVWLLLPGFGHCFLWLTGSCSYLWAITFIILYLYQYFSRFMNKGNLENGKANICLWKEALGLACAFFVGAYSENGAFSALAISFCFLALIVLRDRKLPLKLLLRFAACCCGFLFLMLSPTELGRKNAESSGEAVSLLQRLGISVPVLAVLLLIGLAAAAVFLWAVMHYRKVFCKLMAYLAAAVMLAALVLLAPAELADAEGVLNKLNVYVSETALSMVLIFGLWFVLLMWALAVGADTRHILAAVIFGIGAAASVAVFAVTIYFPARAICVACIYTSVSDMLLLSAICDCRGERPAKLAAAVLLALFVPVFVAGSYDIAQVHSQNIVRKEIIAQAQQEGRDSLILDPLEAAGKYAAVWQGEAADYFLGMEEYYRIPSIIIIGAEEF